MYNKSQSQPCFTLENCRAVGSASQPNSIRQVFPESVITQLLQCYYLPSNTVIAPSIQSDSYPSPFPAVTSKIPHGSGVLLSKGHPAVSCVHENARYQDTRSPANRGYNERPSGRDEPPSAASIDNEDQRPQRYEQSQLSQGQRSTRKAFGTTVAPRVTAPGVAPRTTSSEMKTSATFCPIRSQTKPSKSALENRVETDIT